MWVAENGLSFAIRDAFEVSPGHTLVIPKRLVATWFDATLEEQRALMELVDVVKRDLDMRNPRPDGYNVGFNAGVAAGQTVMHLHVHVIPRYLGDMEDPRGGVRHVIPDKGNYLRGAPLVTGSEDDPFSAHLLPLFEVAERIAIVTAFAQESGVRRIEPYLQRAIARGSEVRLVTGDYLEITQVSALERLLDLQAASQLPDNEHDDEAARGRMEVRVVEVEQLPGRTRSFHPKSWRVEGGAFAVAFVGSSNLSLSALDTAIEWNLRVDRARDPAAYRSVCDAFEKLWKLARPLDSDWIDAYAARARARPQMLPSGELETEPDEPLPLPHEAQSEALAALRKARLEGRRRALVVLATGLGKTLLSVLDYAQLWEETGRRPRLLFLAHRRELLVQAAGAFRRMLRDRAGTARVGWFAEGQSELSADLVFASVAKLSRSENLERLRREKFDYVVVDEVHHAAARSYRDILDALDPTFLLGLTATPDRADAADVAGLFDDHIAYRAGIETGIALKRLVPFRYHGIRDDIDYENIPWRNRRFDPEQLAHEAQTEERMHTMWRAWQSQPGTRTLIFCCSVAHAKFVRVWLRERHVKVAAVFAEAGSDDREQALKDLESGAIEAVCAVDVFNEGVDVPSIDRVVMLRPTESTVIFLQQLGRGLRAAGPNKTALTVIDFVGNHRIFVERVRTVLALGGSNGLAALRTMLAVDGPAELPAGCSVDLELEAKELLSTLFTSRGADTVERAYRELRAQRERGDRPRAGELLRMGYSPASLRERHGSWLDFVNGEGDLAELEQAALRAAGTFLRDLETMEMSRALKMVTLEALLDVEALANSIDLLELARRAHAIIRRSPELWADVAESERVDDLTQANEEAWLAYCRGGPIDAWTSAKAGRRVWFRVDGNRLVRNFDVDPSLEAPLARLTAELVDYRLSQYRTRLPGFGAVEGFVCRLLSNGRDPILKLPKERVQLPNGEVEVRLPDGSVRLFRFAKEYCNVALRPGQTGNELPSLLRGWFGPTAGQPGTAFQVRFRATPDGLWVEPEKTEAAPVLVLTRRSITSYPDLRAAAGLATDAIESPEGETVQLPLEQEPSADAFAVRVSGSSMDGGRDPLRDGDWAVFQRARGASAASVEGRIALVEVPAETAGSTYQIKRVVNRDGAWRLASDNPAGPELDATDTMMVIARFERAIRPSLSPQRWAPCSPRANSHHASAWTTCVRRRAAMAVTSLPSSTPKGSSSHPSC
jgi:superfamily II DNA or RNA helicase/diadenosine tetraphosphate (Ap4A) HIT family hydrolase/HKD family nuclease/SOS-response transcriptional repressor LexA